MAEELRCPFHDPKTHLEQIGRLATVDARTLSLIGAIRKALKSSPEPHTDIVVLLGNEDFHALNPKQRAYVCMFTFYTVVYKERGVAALTYIKQHGIPHGDAALSVIFGNPYSGKGLSTAEFDTEVQRLSQASQRCIRACMLSFNEAVRSGNALNSHDTETLLRTVLQFSAKESVLTSLPMLMTTKGALAAFADHIDAFTEAAVRCANETPELYARKKEIIEYTLLNNLLPLASHAQAVETLYNSATQSIISEPSPLVLCKDAEGHLFVTRQITATQSHVEIVKAVGRNNTLELRVGCPMFYHPLLKDMIRACAHHAARMHA